MSNLHQVDIVMKDPTIGEQAKELQEQRKISNIVSFIFDTFTLINLTNNLIMFDYVSFLSR